MGLSADHLYDTCPARQRSLPELTRCYGDAAGRLVGSVNPLGTDACGTCVRVWRSRQAKAVTL